MAAKELSFDSGLKEFRLNNTVSVRFNPTDNNFISRMYDIFEELDKKQEEYKGERDRLTESKEIFDFARARDTEMRQILDGLFDQPICEPLFGSMNVYALANGFPVWANLMLAILDEISDSVDRETASTNPRLEKYIAKYRPKKK